MHQTDAPVMDLDDWIFDEEDGKPSNR